MFNKNHKDYVSKLENYMDKYEYNYADILLGIKIEFSDIIYEEHKIGCYLVDSVIIGIQLLLVVIGVVCAFFGLKITTITCSFTLILLAILLVNNAIHDYAWRKSKKRLREIEKIMDKIKVDNK